MCPSVFPGWIVKIVGIPNWNQGHSYTACSKLSPLLIKIILNISNYWQILLNFLCSLSACQKINFKYRDWRGWLNFRGDNMPDLNSGSHSHMVCALRPHSHDVLWGRKITLWNSACQGISNVNYPWSDSVQTDITASHPPSVYRARQSFPRASALRDTSGLVAEIKQDHQLSASCFPRTRWWQLVQGNMMCCPLPSGEGLAHYTPSLHPFMGGSLVSVAFVLLCWFTSESLPITFYFI